MALQLSTAWRGTTFGSAYYRVSKILVLPPTTDLFVELDWFVDSSAAGSQPPVENSKRFAIGYAAWIVRCNAGVGPVAAAYAGLKDLAAFAGAIDV